MALTEQQIRQITDEIVRSLTQSMKTDAPAAAPRQEGGCTGRWLCDTAEEAVANAKAAQAKLAEMTLEKRGELIAAMRKAGADQGATGENSVVVVSRTADIIVGPIGILVADAMLGEITEKMALAVGRSTARKLLLPVNQCGNLIAGTQSMSLSRVMEEAVSMLKDLLA